MVKIRDVVTKLEHTYPPNLAEEWDRVGLVVGDPDWDVTTVGFAVDPCEATINEAIERGAQLLVTHHPLYLRGTSSVAATGGKGSWVTALIRAGVGLFSAHTNADAARGGTAEAFADILGLRDQRPLDPAPSDPTLGIGRVGELELSMTVSELAHRIKAVIPETPAGITIGGDPERIVRRVAVSPGSGDSYLELATSAGADVYITADLRHHPATDHLWNGGCALIGLTHFASEWPLLPHLRNHVAPLGVNTYVSTIITDPWTTRI